MELGSLLPRALERIFAIVATRSGSLGSPGAGLHATKSVAEVTALQFRDSLLPGQRGTLSYLWANRKDAVAEWQLIRGQLEPTSSSAVIPSTAHPLQQHSVLDEKRLLEYGCSDNAASEVHKHVPWNTRGSEVEEAAISVAAGKDLATLLDRTEALSEHALSSHQLEHRSFHSDQHSATSQHDAKGASRDVLSPSSYDLPGYEPLQPGHFGLPSPPAHFHSHYPSPPPTTLASSIPEVDLSLGDLQQHTRSSRIVTAASSWLPFRPPVPLSDAAVSSRKVLVLSTSQAAQPTEMSKWVTEASPAPPLSLSSHKPVHLPSVMPQKQQWGVSDRAEASIYVRAARAAAKHTSQLQSSASTVNSVQPQPILPPSSAAQSNWREREQLQRHLSSSRHQPLQKQALSTTIEIPSRSESDFAWQSSQRQQSELSSRGRSTRISLPPPPPPQSRPPSPQLSNPSVDMGHRAGNLQGAPLYRVPGTPAQSRNNGPTNHPPAVRGVSSYSSLHEPVSATFGHELGRARPQRPHACIEEGIFIEEPPRDVSDTSYFASAEVPWHRDTGKLFLAEPYVTLTELAAM